MGRSHPRSRAPGSFESSSSFPSGATRRKRRAPLEVHPRPGRSRPRAEAETTGAPGFSAAAGPSPRESGTSRKCPSRSRQPRGPEDPTPPEPTRSTPFYVVARRVPSGRPRTPPPPRRSAGGPRTPAASPGPWSTLPAPPPPSRMERSFGVPSLQGSWWESPIRSVDSGAVTGAGPEPEAPSGTRPLRKAPRAPSVGPRLKRPDRRRRAGGRSRAGCRLSRRNRRKGSATRGRRTAGSCSWRVR